MFEKRFMYYCVFILIIILYYNNVFRNDAQGATQGAKSKTKTAIELLQK